MTLTGTRRALSGVLVTLATVVIAGVSAGGAEAALNPWDYIYGCPVSDAPMLTVPAGTQSSCVDLGAHDTQYNVGSKQSPADFIDLGFGVIGGLDGSGSPVLGNAYDALGEFPVGTGVSLPYLDLCALYPVFSSQWRQCEAGGDPLSTVNGLEGTVDGVAYNLTQLTVKLVFAGPPSNFNLSGIETPGQPALVLPVRFQISFPGAGSSCSVGTDAKPIVLRLLGTQAPSDTSSASDPNGYPVSFKTDSDSVIADTSFAEPGATGCGPGDLLDPVVSSLLGVPSPAGHNAFTMGSLVAALATTTAGGQVLSQSYTASGAG